MRYPPAILEQIKARLNLVDDVRRAVPALKKKGTSWWAPCPFHNEKSPSFHVREQQQDYKCFGCGASGDIFSFAMEIRGLSFPQVVEELAERAGVKLPEKTEENPQSKQAREDGYKALERAAVFYQRSLNETSRAYIAKRALSPATVEEFQLGYSPAGWNDLKDALLAEDFSPEILRTAGLTLTSEKGKGDYDRFRDRLMFPIHDGRGRIVGFGGRVMGSGEPKYLNSPETPFFSKSHLLFNLHRAREHIRRTKQALLVEGYMDAIALWQAGIKTALAPLGTSVTPEQITLLWQQIDNPIICLDGDAAGRTAAARLAAKALPLLEPGKSLGFVFLPDGEDPDSLIQKDGPGAMHQLLANPTPLEQVLWQQATAAHNLSTADGRAAAEGAINAYLAEIKHQTTRRAYQQVLKDKLWQATRQNRGPGAKEKPGTFKPAGQAAADYRPAIQGDASARAVLSLLTYRPHLLADHGEVLASLHLPHGALQELQQTLTRALTRGQIGLDNAASWQSELLAGPHAATVADLWRSTGVEALPPETDWQAELHTHARAHAQRQRQAAQKAEIKQKQSFSAEYFQALQSATQRAKRNAG